MLHIINDTRVPVRIILRSSYRRIRAAFVLGYASARVSTFHVVSCMALPLTDYEPEVCLKASRPAQRGEPRR